MASPLLQLDGVTRRYDGLDTPVLAGVDLTLDAGDSLAIVGPSGCGKSTLLNIIGALDQPTAGRVRVGEHDLGAMSPRALAGFRASSVGFVFQSHHLLPQLSALENVLVPTLACPDSATRGEAHVRAAELLRRVGMGDRMGHRPSQLSGGQCQRVAIVRSLINTPRLLLADEPTGSLDAAAVDEVVTLLDELHREQGVTLIVVTHAMPLARRMRRVMTLRGGRLYEGEVAT
jgi:ABC-type lipoprotein export system ATPase subunit